MSKPAKIILLVLTVILILAGGAVLAMQRMSYKHMAWHDCRDNCLLIDDAKKICAEQRRLREGAVLSWEDIEPYFIKSTYWGTQHPSANAMPTCPSGGTYALGKTGAHSLCSVPYHQWPNCKSKGSGSEWR